MTQLTIRIPIRATQESLNALWVTALQYTESFNQVCFVGWQQKRINGVELHHKTYKEQRAWTDLPAQLICSARVKATEALKSVRALQRKGKKISCPQSGFCAIHYDARSARIKLREGEASLSTIQGRVKVKLKIAPYYQNRLDWKVCSADLINHRNKPYLHVVVERPDPKIHITRAVGVDLGVSRPAITSDAQFLGERRWKEIEQRNFRLRRALQAKGTKSAKRHLKKLGRRVNRFRRDCDHVLTKRLVNSQPPGTLFVLEDLTDIRDRVRARKRTKRAIHGWSFQRFQFFLEYKAKLCGHAVAYVDPRYTSQKCSRCGYTARHNRRTQSDFRCHQCDFQLNADLNAARNIRANHLASEAKSAAGGLPVNQPIVGACSHATHKPLPLGRGS